ncbi:MAG: hypothetical protein NTX17_00635 [Candidatus Eisenbacteria bacterium]|nr:hypothetical protein [Candidatus Eisenbacteria bacterium]
MRKGLWVTRLVVQVFLFGCFVVCAPGPTAAVDASFMNLDEIRPGMKGKAKSVFLGSRIEEFDVEILGVLRNWRPGGDLILARASGPQVDNAGIAAGMSGTPVYVEGKLIGAMAYTWAFSKEPIVGVTPIKEMLGLETAGIGSGSAQPRSRNDLSSGDWEIPAGTMKAIETPLLVSGFHPAVLRVIEQEASGLNMVVAQTGGAGGSVEGDTLVPGAAMAAQFVRGDGVVAAIGTVTYTEGARVLGFGHGLMLGNLAGIPMSTAYVHTVLPSLAGSVKLASPLRMVGKITGESLSGVLGEIGSVPSLVPVGVVVKTGTGGERTFHFDVVKNKLLTGMLVGWSATSAALTLCGAVGDMTIKAAGEIEFVDKHGATHEVEYENVLFTTDPASAISKMVSAPVETLLNNQFEEADVRRIDCTLLVRREQRVASIEEVSVRPEEVMPGDSIRVTVKLKPFRGEVFLRRFSLVVPLTCEAERARILVCSAPEMRVWEEQSTNRRLPPANLEQLMSQIESSGRGDRLECVLSARSEEAGIEGKPFPSPPSSFSSVLDSSTRSGALTETPLGILGAVASDTDYALEGRRSVSLKIKHQKAGR